MKYSSRKTSSVADKTCINSNVHLNIGSDKGYDTFSMNIEMFKNRIFSV